MPVTEATLREALRLRTRIDRHVDQATGDMVRAWARLWNELSKDWAKAVDQIITSGSTGRLSKAQLFRLAKVRQVLAASSEALDQLAAQATSITITRLPALVSDATAGELAVIVSQLPDELGGLDTVTGRAVTAITRRATEQVTSLTRPLAADAYQVMLAEVQRGVALGVNPRVAARRMLQRTKGGFDGGLARATRIARTEMLDAFRAAAQASDEANTDVLVGWRWNATLSPRTCPACLAMNGRIFPTSTPGPQGHVNCRCARTPVTKSWADLGFPDLDEPADRGPDARAWFDHLPEPQQLAIMGPTRLHLLQSGAIGWDDIAVKVPNTGWRPSWQPRPLSDLRSVARRSA
jgi:SPP1 gp7 family putative phage head morphogenesis protein